MAETIAKEIINGNLNGVKAFIEAGEPIDAVDEYGYIPLIQAAIMRNTAIAQYLLEQGAKVDETDITGRTALHWAADTNNTTLIKVLLKYNANPNAYTMSRQPVLVYPLLRDHETAKALLLSAGADLNFALDFINTKLIGHRFELTGQVDIVTHDNAYVDIDYEGFFLEFTISIIENSLRRFRNHFAARRYRHLFSHFDKAIQCYQLAAELIRYDHYTVDLNAVAHKLDPLLDSPLLLLPVAYQGHAISFIRYGNYLAKCDRGMGRSDHGSVVINHMGQAAQFNPQFIKHLLYNPQARHFMEVGIFEILDLKPVVQLPIGKQIAGNCSWANIEAALPTLMFVSMMSELSEHERADKLIECKKEALDFYHAWIEWDKDIAITECVASMKGATIARQASKASVLGRILFESCNSTIERDVMRADKIVKILSKEKYSYVLDSYILAYYFYYKTSKGKAFVHLLEMCDTIYDWHSLSKKY